MGRGSRASSAQATDEHRSPASDQLLGAAAVPHASGECPAGVAESSSLPGLRIRDPEA